VTTLSIDPFPLLDDLPLPSMTRSAEHDALDGLRRQAVLEGRRSGFEEGRLEGRARGAAEARAELGAQIDALGLSIRDAAERVCSSVAGHNAETGHAVIELALEIAELVVGREVAAASDPGRDALVRAVAVAPDRGDILARLHPDDLAVLRAGDDADDPGRFTDLTGGRAMTLVADPTVGPGGCVLDVSGSRVDARVASALDRVRAVLVGPTEAPAEPLP